MTGSLAADLVILGGGPAGVGAAFRAARAGHRVVVVERGQGPGGLAGSFELEGVRVDHGSHRLHPAIEPRILADLRGLLGEELQRRPRNGRLFLEGRWIRFPLRPADLARRLPPSFAVAAAREAATGWARRPRADTFAEVLRAGLGPTMCERFYFPYARKLWGLDPAELAGEQARRRVTAASPARLLARLARGVGTGGSCFWYPRRGFGTISERLAEAAAAAGAELRFGAAAERVRLAIEMAEIPLPSGDLLKVTASFGCAGRANDGASRSFEDLVKRADLALYAAKASGRNCVVSGPVVPAPPQEERRKTASGGGFDSRL